MAQLLIQFTDAELESLRWVAIDEERARADLAWQAGNTDDLPAITAQNPHPVVLVIPQQCVYLTQVELPEKASRQILAAIEYQVEDQLAQDIDSQHFAVGDASENPVSLAVIEKAIMDRCIELARAHGLRLLQIIPEVFLCPWPGDGVNLIAGDDGLLVRYGAYRGLKCHPRALPAMLSLVRRDVEFDRVRYFETSGNEPPAPGEYPIEIQSAGDARLGYIEAPYIDLQQRDYQLSSAWRGVARAWRWVAIILAALLLVGGYNRAIALQELEDRLAAVKAEQYELVKLYLPASTRPGDNLKKLLIERLKLLQSGQNGRGFMQLLQDFAAARARFATVRIDRIAYQNRQLNVDLNSRQLQYIEALHVEIQKQGVDARLENLNIKPDLISGRLVMRGGSDG